ncbi:MAG: ATP-binding protein, partial [Microcystaceae cyanobacterium]
MLSSIFEACEPRAEILSGELSLDLFAAKLRLVVEGKAPLVYQSPDLFFANTYPTNGIRNLIREVFGRLMGQIVGAPVIRLETSFGGGKTHDEIALWHICKKGRAIAGVERFADLSFLPTETVQVAAIDGRDLDFENGIFHRDTGITTKTLWGEIAYQIRGIAGYQLLQGSDQSGVSPGTSVMERLMGDKPTVIILDEIARHLRSAKGEPIQDSNLGKQVVSFLFSLMDLAASCNYLVFVYSLASASDTFAEETQELQELISASARQERILTPSTDVEVYNIVKQRLFKQVENTAGEQAATEYLQAIRTSHANLPDAAKDAQYAQAIAQSYPFHPELFNLLTKKIASIPQFQKTRGALRLFAQVVRYLWQNHDQDWIPLIHTHHIPIGVEEDVTSELTSRLDRALMRNPIGADIYNPTGREAYAQVQDQQWLLAGKLPFSTWVARTIFLHSLNQGTAAGITRAELNLSLLTPGLEIGFVDRVLEQLVAVAFYLDDDPVTSRSRFKEEPSINKIIAEEKEQIGQTDAKNDLRDRRDSIFAKKLFTLIPAPDNADDVDDRPDDIALCVIDFGDAMVNQSTDP